MKGAGMASNRATAAWREKLVNSREWRELVADYTEAMVRRALGAADRDDAARIIEVSRDLKGLAAFRLWIDNDVTQSRKAGDDDRPNREAGKPAGAGDPTIDRGSGGG
jgi:hypothetical protein